MTKKTLVIGSLAMLSLVIAICGQTAGQSAQSAAASDTAAAQRAIVAQYCSTCHSDKAKAAGMDSARKIDFDALDIAHVSRDAETWERIVRKLRAGMMPPSGMRRPDPATYKGLITWLENELDRNAVTYTPPPGLHRLNRTEYANVLKDLLDLDIDPAKYLPSDDSTHGFDNIAGALGVSSTLVEAYVSAAQKISRLAIGEAATPSLTVYRTPEDTSQDYHIEGLPFGTRGGMLIKHVFPSDGEYQITMTPIFGDNMSPQGVGSVPCEKLEGLLDGERIELLDWQGGGRTPPVTCGGRQVAAVQSGQTGLDLGRTSMKVRISTKAGPHELGVTFLQTNLAPILDLDQHFMRDTVQTGPTPGFTYFPHVGTVRIEGPFNAKQAEDSPSRRKIFICRPAGATDETACARKIVSNLATHAFRRPANNSDVDSLVAFYQDGRKEGNFDQGIENALARLLTDPKFIYRIVREDRSVTDLLTADYTFINERLAKHYGIPNIYGSQFRRVTLGPDMDVRKGLTGKGAFLVTTAKPERTSPVTRGKWIMTNILGMSPPDPPPNVPPLPARITDAAGNTREPSMRQKMLDHRVRSDCVQCHSMMDPIGFSLENFDAIASWRTHDEGNLVDPAAT